MNVTGLEGAALVLWTIPAVILYFVVRLAVQHGMRHARRDQV